MGIEREYENFLKGTQGKQLAETDSAGKGNQEIG